MSARIFANSPDKWVVTVECPHSNMADFTNLTGERDIVVSECGADVDVTLTGVAIWTVPTHCTECKREYSIAQRTQLMQAAEYAWDKFEPSESALEQWSSQGDYPGELAHRQDLARRLK